LRGTLGMVQAPEESDWTVRVKPLMELERVTEALGIRAPVASVTVPETVPALPAVWVRAGDCAWSVSAARDAIAIVANDTKMPRLNDVCMYCPLCYLMRFDEVLERNEVRQQGEDG
jgi:hypothetical protein